MRVVGLNGRLYHFRDLRRFFVKWDRKVSGPQKAVKDALRPYWDRPGIIVTEETVLPGCGKPLRMDLMNWNRKIAIEVSPSSSHDFNPWFHKNRAQFSASVKRDLQKAEWARLNEWTFCELTEKDIPLLTAAWFERTYGRPLA